MNKIIDIYNELCRKFPNQDEVKETDIINSIGYEHFILLTRSFFIVPLKKDDYGIFWYKL